MTKLFLDDLRSAPDGSWTVVRSFDEFCAYIRVNGTPQVISFDHDLGEGQPTGMDCAKWMVENDRPIHEFLVHSANPPGAENIRGLLSNWQRECLRRSLGDG